MRPHLRGPEVYSFLRRSWGQRNPDSKSGFALCPHGVVLETLKPLGPALGQLSKPEAKEKFSGPGLPCLYVRHFYFVDFSISSVFKLHTKVSVWMLSFGAPYAECPAVLLASWPCLAHSGSAAPARPIGHTVLSAHILLARLQSTPPPGCHPPSLFPRLHCWHGLLSRNTGHFMGRNLIGAMVAGDSRWGLSQLPVAPSQARGDFGVTPSVCLICSRHSLGSERATCPLRPPPTHLSPQAWLLPPGACPAPCPRADATRRAGPAVAAGRWQSECRLLTPRQPCSGAPFMPRAQPRCQPSSRLAGGVPLVCLRTPAGPSPKRRGGLCCPSRGRRPMVTPRAVGQLDPANHAPQHTGLAPCLPPAQISPRTGHRPSNVNPIPHPHPTSPGVLAKASASFCVSLPLVGAKPEEGPCWGSRCLLLGHLGARVGCECGSRPRPRWGAGCRHCSQAARTPATPLP